MARSHSVIYAERVTTEAIGYSERLPLRSAALAIIGLALLGWAVVLLPVALLLRL